MNLSVISSRWVREEDFPRRKAHKVAIRGRCGDSRIWQGVNAVGCTETRRAMWSFMRIERERGPLGHRAQRVTASQSAPLSYHRP